MIPEKTISESMAISSAELHRLLGDIEDSKIVAILELRPTVAEVEQAAVWAGGMGDVADRAGHPLVGAVAQIFEILTSDEEEPPPTG